MTNTKSCLKWIGGKSKNIDRYLKLMPPHKNFLSEFCGACHVEIAKQEAHTTLVNDKNDELINFLLVLRDYPDELYKKCEGLPYSEKLYNSFKWDEISQDPIERAVRFFYIVRCGFSGGGHKYKTGFSISLSESQNKAKSYRSNVELIKHISGRIKNWIITCRDFQDIIERYDTKDTLHFLDPPYVGCEDLYSGGFASQDHTRLRKCLENIKGKAMVCYFDCPEVRELYSDWHILSYQMRSRIQKRDHGEVCPERTELIILNYKPQSGLLY